MCLVKTKIKYPDDEADCTQAFRVARTKEKEKKNPPKRCSFSGSHSQSKPQQSTLQKHLLW